MSIYKKKNKKYDDKKYSFIVNIVITRICQLFLFGLHHERHSLISFAVGHKHSHATRIIVTI